jgi:AcrR family transcriptional regulator
VSQPSVTQRAVPRPRTRTRERVLEVTLALFNERGVDRVTTAEIADTAGINEGNLYYYFQKKEQLALAIFDLFAEALIATAERQVTDPADPNAYAAYHRGWFELMWDYRFFYRDGAALRILAPSVRDKVQSLTMRGQAEVRRVFGLMRAHGFLRATDDEIAILIDNLWIVSSYWMDYRLRDTTQITQADLAWGFRQVEMLAQPYLTEAGRVPLVSAVPAGTPSEASSARK